MRGRRSPAFERRTKKAACVETLLEGECREMGKRLHLLSESRALLLLC